jgi:O-methyltransferase involved in polyketide biosynthesis
MEEKIEVKLGNVQKTLLLPLWGRAVESQKEKPLFVDKTAIEIIQSIDYDFGTLSKGLSETSILGWVYRSLLIDEVIKEFIDRHPKATIVNIGCGMDTTFERIDNGTIYWYDLDLPDTIDLRKRFIKENNRRKFIVSSFLDEDWLKKLVVSDNVLFVSAGVFYYFEESQIRTFFQRVSDLFPGCEMVFDATTPTGIKMANKMVIKSTGLDESSYLKWGLKNTNDLQKWDNRIKILKEQSLFKNLKTTLRFQTRMKLFFSDLFKMQYLIHIKLSTNK